MPRGKKPSSRVAFTAMLLDRLYSPGKDDVLYHYCSAATLQAILSSGRVRFGDINMLNDSQEFRWGYSVFEEAATRLIKRDRIPEQVPNIDGAFIDSIDQHISPIQLVAHPFVACFSSEWNSLPQWRMYGDDGRGFALGFRASALCRMPVTMLKVEYDREQQVLEMIQAIVATHARRHQSNLSDQEFMFDCQMIATYMVAFKHSAFAYENEIRCVHVVNVKRTDTQIRFVDPGGVSAGTDVSGETIGFQVLENHLAAFLDIRIPTFEDGSGFLSEIVVGPKNGSVPGNVQLFLGACGLPMAKLRYSDAPYR
jgi:Protein of unknown function (DUF2971)